MNFFKSLEDNNPKASQFHQPRIGPPSPLTIAATHGAAVPCGVSCRLWVYRREVLCGSFELFLAGPQLSKGLATDTCQ